MSIWVCIVCGKSAREREGLHDVSCYIHAIECEEDSIVRDEYGRVVEAKAVQTWAKPPVCPTCGQLIDKPFKDKLSKREFQISGMCQECQDKTFGTGEE